jgi:predicted phage terminase large subunit-like protein
MNHSQLRRYAALQDELLTRQAAQSLRSFVEQAWPVLEPTTPFLPNWHIDLICEHLEAITAGQVTRLLINLPPRYMKSLLVSVFWPVWEWISYPSRRWICVSYSDSLSLKLSLDRRTLVQSDWYRARWGHTVRLSSDQNVKGEFRNTAQGVMFATSVGGSATGKGGDRIIVDDLHNPQQADSDAQRESALRFFRETLSTRLDTPRTGAVVVVMQRLHEADLSALCLELGYPHLCLPVKAETGTDIVFPRSGRVLTREPGDLLWPAREGPTELAIQQRQLGSTAFDTQYQQRPAPAGGRLFKREWFKFYDELPRAGTWLESWDMSFKGGPSNDYVVGLQAAREGADVYLIDRVKGQWDFTQTCRQVVSLHQRYPQTRTILIEEAANGAAIINVLSRQITGIIPVTPDGGKHARAQAALPIVEAGNVWLPNPRPHGRALPERAWVEDFLHQLCAFPTGAHDDDVDAFSQLVARCVQPEPCTWVTW